MERRHRRSPGGELSCDNLLSAEVVTVGGEVLRASAGQHPELFWALRGGGGNFGVVTEFEFRLHPVGLAQLGLFFWDADDGEAALAVAQQVTADLSPRMGALIAGLNAPPAPFVPEQHHFRPGFALIVAAFGAAAGHARLAGQIRSALLPLVEFIAPIPYTGLQQILDEAMPRKQSPMSNLLGVPMGGAFCQVPDEATAFGGSRAPCVVVDAAAFAPEPGLLAADRDWARQLWAGLLPYSQGPGSYVNLMADYDADRVRASYCPAKYQRLAQIKAAYDPGNVFHRNANISWRLDDSETEKSAEALMNHVHRACRSLASLTRLAGMPFACRAAEPALAAATRRGPSRPATHSPRPAPARTITTSKPPRRRAARPAAGKAAHHSPARPAAAHHPALRPLPGQTGRVLGQLHRRPDSAPTLVPVLLPGTGP